MAAHDEQISQRRRQLFKALSAAPVVATLAPSQAAAGSAYQCLKEITDGGEPDHVYDGNGCGSSGCWASLPCDKFEVPATGCTWDHPLHGMKIVKAERPDGYYPQNTYHEYTGPGELGPEGTDWVKENADGTISIRKKLGSDQICFANLPKKGDAYMLVKSTVDDRYNPKKWHYSEHKKYTKFPSNSDVYGITHSCMVSVDPDNVDKFFYLSNG